MEVVPRNTDYIIIPKERTVSLNHLEEETEPAFTLQFIDDAIDVNSHNAEMYVYKEEVFGRTYDHLQVTGEDGRVYMIKMTPELSDLLFEAEFDYHWSKRPSQEVYQELGALALLDPVG